jgi:virulence-associated protein VagC
MEHVKQIDARGAVVIPRAFRGNFTHVEVTQREDGVIELRPRIMIDPTQAWFWSQPWQAGEAQAQADIDAGRTKRFENGDDFLAELRAQPS